MIIKTESGSIYDIDIEKKKWTRIVKGEQSNEVRTASGDICDISQIKVGQQLIIIGPPLVSGMTGRAILTSPIVEII